MEQVFLTASIGLIGVGLGSISSFSTTWLTQRTQLRETRRAADRKRRQSLYRDFIKEASRLYGDALGNEKDDISALVGLYAHVAEMRLVASEAVIVSATRVMESIVEGYLAPNRTLHEVRELHKAGSFDFLLEFGEVCRAELEVQCH